MITSFFERYLILQLDNHRKDYTQVKYSDWSELDHINHCIDYLRQVI
jgi:hypothetical protein